MITESTASISSWISSNGLHEVITIEKTVSNKNIFFIFILFKS
jgi:hypothetical protein